MYCPSQDGLYPDSLVYSFPALTSSSPNNISLSIQLMTVSLPRQIVFDQRALTATHSTLHGHLRACRKHDPDPQRLWRHLDQGSLQHRGGLPDCPGTER